MHDLLEEFQATIIATSTTSGTGDFVLSGSQPYTAGPDRLTHGQTVWYHRYYSDGTTSGSEWGKATVSTATSPGPSLTNKVVQRSTASPDDTPVFWSTAETNVAISASPEMMTQFSKICADMEPGEQFLVVITGQSNTHATLGSVARPYPRLIDWCSDGSSAPINSPDEFDRSSLAWRAWDPEKQNSDKQTQYAGIIARSPNGSPDTWVYNASPDLIFAGELSNITGRYVRTVKCTSTGTNIDDTRGWAYDPSPPGSPSVYSKRTSAWLSEEITNALAALPAGTGITAPHFFLIFQGELEASTKNTAQYSMLLSDFIDACYDSDRWGWAVDGFTQTLVLDYPQGSWRRTYPDFRGHAVACDLQKSRAKLVPTEGLVQYEDTWDNVHYTEAACVKIANRMLNMVAATSGSLNVGFSGMTIGRTWQEDAGLFSSDGLSLIGYSFSGTASDSPPSSGAAYENTAGTAVLFHKTDLFGTDTSYFGVHMLRNNPAGDSTAQITFSFLTLSRVYNIDGHIIDRDTYWELPATKQSGTGTGALFIELTACRVWPDYSMHSRSALPLGAGSNSMANTSLNSTRANRGPLLADNDGIYYRLKRCSYYEGDLTTISGATTTRIFATRMLLPSDYRGTSDAFLVEATILAQQPSSASSTGAWIVRRVLRWSGTQFVAHGTTQTTVIQESGSPGLQWDIVNWNNGGNHTLAVQTGGVAGETWEAQAEVKITKLDF